MSVQALPERHQGVPFPCFISLLQRAYLMGLRTFLARPVTAIPDAHTLVRSKTMICSGSGAVSGYFLSSGTLSRLAMWP
jgi:hypothetical protein